MHHHEVRSINELFEDVGKVTKVNFDLIKKSRSLESLSDNHKHSIGKTDGDSNSMYKVRNPAYYVESAIIQVSHKVGVLIEERALKENTLSVDVAPLLDGTRQKLTGLRDKQKCILDQLQDLSNKESLRGELGTAKDLLDNEQSRKSSLHETLQRERKKLDKGKDKINMYKGWVGKNDPVSLDKKLNAIQDYNNVKHDDIRRDLQDMLNGKLKSKDKKNLIKKINIKMQNLIEEVSSDMDETEQNVEYYSQQYSGSESEVLRIENNIRSIQKKMDAYTKNNVSQDNISSQKDGLNKQLEQLADEILQTERFEKGFSERYTQILNDIQALTKTVDGEIEKKEILEQNLERYNKNNPFSSDAFVVNALDTFNRMGLIR